MSRYTGDSRDRVRDAVDMVALVCRRRSSCGAPGVNSYFGCCPFHDERTASFHVSPDEKLYHCFGCSESGDPFDFVMQTEGLDFKGALESLADRFGVTLADRGGGSGGGGAAGAATSGCTRLLTRATTFYGRYLWEAGRRRRRANICAAGASARRRCGSSGSGTRPALGSPRARLARGRLHATRSCSPPASRGAGATAAAALIDRFRERIMFPTSDARGRVRGFGARAMREDQRAQVPQHLRQRALPQA